MRLDDTVLYNPFGWRVAEIADLRSICVESGVKLIGCQMTVDLFGFSPADFIPEVSEYCGATRFLPMHVSRPTLLESFAEPIIR